MQIESYGRDRIYRTHALDAPREVSRHLRRYDTRGKGDAQEDMKAKGEYILAVIYVNGMRQYSASNRKYVSPKL